MTKSSKKNKFPNIFYGSQIQKRNRADTSQMQNTYLQKDIIFRQKYFQIFSMVAKNYTNKILKLHFDLEKIALRPRM